MDQSKSNMTLKQEPDDSDKKVAAPKNGRETPSPASTPSCDDDGDVDVDDDDIVGEDQGRKVLTEEEVAKKIESMKRYADLRHHKIRLEDAIDPNAERVYELKPNDIVFGRGKWCQRHQGNQRMRKITEKYKIMYHTMSRKEKRALVDKVFEELVEGGNRFLKKLDGEQTWVVVDDPIALQKVCHTLRCRKNFKKALREAERRRAEQGGVTFPGDNFDAGARRERPTESYMEPESLLERYASVLPPIPPNQPGSQPVPDGPRRISRIAHMAAPPKNKKRKKAPSPKKNSPGTNLDSTVTGVSSPARRSLGQDVGRPVGTIPSMVTAQHTSMGLGMPQNLYLPLVGLGQPMIGLDPAAQLAAMNRQRALGLLPMMNYPLPSLPIPPGAAATNLRRKQLVHENKLLEHLRNSKYKKDKK